MNAVQLVFRDKSVFIADFIQEDQKSITVNYKGSAYKVPKSELDHFDITKVGAHDSYYLVEWKLKDGSTIRGEYVEENEDNIIIKSDLGFLSVDRSKISGDTPNLSIKPNFNEKFLFVESGMPTSNLGLGAYYLYSASLWNRSITGILGGSIFIEPAFVQYDSLQFGFKLDISRSDPNSSTTFYTGIIYGMWEFYKVPDVDLSFFASFGLGGSGIQITTPIGSGGNRIGQGVASDLGVGIELPVGKDLFLRTTMRNLCIWEQNQTLCTVGLELSGGLRF